MTDDGPGIPATVLPHVFERFARADTARTRASGSTGLGLAIVEAIVQAHDGTVTVTSRPGYTQFEIRLPVGTSLTLETHVPVIEPAVTRPARRRWVDGEHDSEPGQ